MYIPSKALGVLGLMPDQPDHILPFGAWNDGLNIRFNDGYIEKIPDPSLLLTGAAVSEPGKWLQLYDDNSGSRLVYVGETGTEANLYRLNLPSTGWDFVGNAVDFPTGMTPGGIWQSFEWGNAVVFNNGVDAPQILYDGSASFITLPNWGLVTSGQQVVTARVIRPYRGFMVAIDLTIDGQRYPNMVWWSGPGVVDNDISEFDSPSWDWEDPGTSSGRNFVAVDNGPLVEALALGANMMLYTQESADIMTLVGGRNVFSFRKAGFEYGVEGIGAVTAFGNQHFCVSPTTIYTHDGSSVRQIADARIQTTFYRQADSLDNVRCEENVEMKEIHTLFDLSGGIRKYLIYNYKDDNWSFGSAYAGAQQCNAMSYGLSTGLSESWDSLASTWDSEVRTWNEFNATGEKRVMYWLMDDGLYQAESSNALDPGKEYFIIHRKLDFGELDPKITTEGSKHFRQVIPHITGENPAATQLSFGLSDLLRQSPGNVQLFQYDPVTQYKVDPRITGRWLSLRLDIVGNGDWRLSSIDYDLVQEHGR